MEIIMRMNFDDPCYYLFVYLFVDLSILSNERNKLMKIGGGLVCLNIAYLFWATKMQDFLILVLEISCVILG